MRRLPCGLVALAGTAALGTFWAPAAAARGRRLPGHPGLASGWQVRSSAVATDPGSVISQPGYSTAGWLAIHEPETLMAALVENGRYPDVLFSNNLAAVGPAIPYQVVVPRRAEAAPAARPAHVPGRERACCHARTSG